MSTPNLRRRSSGAVAQKKPSVTVQQKLTKRQKDQNEYFTTYGFVIIGLLPIIPRKEREMVEQWMEKLQTMSKNDEERHIRNDYIWFLLVQLENNVVTLPFINPPPEGKLQPVAQAVNKVVYEEILQAANKRASMIEDAEIAKHGEKKEEDKDKKPKEDEDEEDVFKIKPEDFLEKQPVPKRGFIVYGSCFSDQSDAPSRNIAS